MKEFGEGRRATPRNYLNVRCVRCLTVIVTYKGSTGLCLGKAIAHHRALDRTQQRQSRGRSMLTTYA